MVPVVAPDAEAATAPDAAAEDRDQSCARVCKGRARCAGIVETLAFDKGSAALRRDTEPTLMTVARWLQTTPGVKEVEVRGYAHDVAGSRRELIIASNRAGAASKWLSEHGVSTKLIVARGFANAPNDPPHVESGVEFTVTDPDQTGCCDAGRACD